MTISFFRRQLVYEIESATIAESHLVRKTAEPGAVRLLVDICRDGNEDRTMRVVGNVFQEIAILVAPYGAVALPAVTQEIDNRLTVPEVYVFRVGESGRLAPQEWRQIGMLANEAIVSAALADCLAVTFPEREDVWRRRYERSLAAIGCLLSSHPEEVPPVLPVEKARRSLSPI